MLVQVIEHTGGQQGWKALTSSHVINTCTLFGDFACFLTTFTHLQTISLDALLKLCILLTQMTTGNYAACVVASVTAAITHILKDADLLQHGFISASLHTSLSVFSCQHRQRLILQWHSIFSLISLTLKGNLILQ